MAVHYLSLSLSCKSLLQWSVCENSGQTELMIPSSSHFLFVDVVVVVVGLSASSFLAIPLLICPPVYHPCLCAPIICSFFNLFCWHCHTTTYVVGIGTVVSLSVLLASQFLFDIIKDILLKLLTNLSHRSIVIHGYSSLSCCSSPIVLCVCVCVYLFFFYFIWR